MLCVPKPDSAEFASCGQCCLFIRLLLLSFPASETPHYFQIVFLPKNDGHSYEENQSLTFDLHTVAPLFFQELREEKAMVSEMLGEGMAAGGAPTPSSPASAVAPAQSSATPTSNL